MRVVFIESTSKPVSWKTHLQEHFAIEMMMVVGSERRQFPRPVMRIVVRIFFLVFVHHHCNREQFSALLTRFNRNFHL